jgi:uncharacterized protein
MQRYSDIAFTAPVQRRQTRDGSRDHYEQAALRGEPPAGLGADEQTLIGSADSFYLASTSSTGWPYIQHRGGPTGFAHVVDPETIAWAERVGNRQHVTAGNLDHDDRVTLFFMDYPNRARLKLFGRARRIDEPASDLVQRLGGGRVTGVVIVRVEAFDWNCPKYITPRYTTDAVRSITEQLQQRVDQLEAELARLRSNRCP